jgi:Protein of unknown function (DUF2752)
MNKPSRLQIPILIIKMIVYITIPIILIILPADYFDSGQSICLSKVLLDVECFACGMTRAIMHLIHFDWGTAYYYNEISFIVLPILMYLWIKSAWNDWKKLKLLYHIP